MLAKIDNWHVPRKELPRSSGENYLAAVRRGGDTRRKVNIEANEVTFTDKGLACMQTRANPHRARPESGLALRYGDDRLWRGSKNDEARIALYAYLDAVVAGERFAQDAAMH